MTVDPQEAADPAWLVRARALQALAQTGLAFTRDPYDEERYRAVLTLAAELLAEGAGVAPAQAQALFAPEPGYATPKLDVRGAVFDQEMRLLLVRETQDGGRWTLPGGWAEVNQTLAESAVREVREESGYEVEVERVCAVLDRACQGHTPPALQSITKVFFLCRLIGGRAQDSLETSDARFFGEDALPTDLSLGRVTPAQLALMFRFRREPQRPTAWD